MAGSILGRLTSPPGSLDSSKPFIYNFSRAGGKVCGYPQRKAICFVTSSDASNGAHFTLAAREGITAA
jgi:hypothetical protein